MEDYKNLSLENIVYFCEFDNVWKTEIFKDIPGYKGIYQVSDLGRVKSLERTVKKNGFVSVPEKIMSLTKNKYGYLRLVLQVDKIKKYIQVHQLVTMAFLDHKPCGFKLVVNHINFVRSDNRLQNLEIITSRENTNLKHLSSSSKYTGVSWCNFNKKWISYITFNKKHIFLGNFKTEEEASKYYENALKAIELGNEIIKKPFITSSKYIGVHWSKEKKKWVSKIKKNGKTKHLGYFDNEEKARDCYLNYKKNTLI